MLKIQCHSFLFTHKNTPKQKRTRIHTPSPIKPSYGRLASVKLPLCYCNQPYQRVGYRANNQHFCCIVFHGAFTHHFVALRKKPKTHESNASRKLSTIYMKLSQHKAALRLFHFWSADKKDCELFELVGFHFLLTDYLRFMITYLWFYYRLRLTTICKCTFCESTANAHTVLSPFGKCVSNY